MPSVVLPGPVGTGKLRWGGPAERNFADESAFGNRCLEYPSVMPVRAKPGDSELTRHGNLGEAPIIRGFGADLSNVLVREPPIKPHYPTLRTINPHLLFKRREGD